MQTHAESSLHYRLTLSLAASLLRRERALRPSNCSARPTAESPSQRRSFIFDADDDSSVPEMKRIAPPVCRASQDLGNTHTRGGRE